MASLQPYFEEYWFKWDVIDSSPFDGEIDNGFFFFFIRDAVDHAGYYAAPDKSEALYGAIHDEIESAFITGNLEKRFVFPSVFMAPWNSSIVKLFPQRYFDCLKFIISFSKVRTETAYVDDYPEVEVRLFEIITQNFANSAGSNGLYGYYGNYCIENMK